MTKMQLSTEILDEIVLLSKNRYALEALEPYLSKRTYSVCQQVKILKGYPWPVSIKTLSQMSLIERELLILEKYSYIDHDNILKAEGAPHITCEWEALFEKNCSEIPNFTYKISESSSKEEKWKVFKKTWLEYARGKEFNDEENPNLDVSDEYETMVKSYDHAIAHSQWVELL